MHEIPKYRKHATGQAMVRIHGKDHYLGAFGSPESKQKYNRLIAEHLAGATTAQPGANITINELVAHVWRTQNIKMKDRRQKERLKRSAAFLLEFYGDTPASEFGPLALKTVRVAMVVKGWTRTHVNHCVGVLRRIFKLAVADQLVPAAVHTALGLVEDLRKGEAVGEEGHVAPEGRTVVAVPEEDVEPVLAFCLPVVADMARLQARCGARGDELCQMRPADIDRTKPVWEFRPQRHKTEGKGFERVIFLGPHAQAILAPYLLRAADSWCFSPAEAYGRWLADHGRKPSKGKRAPRNVYKASSYGHAIAKACAKYNEAAAACETLAAKLGHTLKVRRIEPWSPHRLRHLAATRLVDEFGEETARKVLGQATLSMAQRYSRKAYQQQREAMQKMG